MVRGSYSDALKLFVRALTTYSRISSGEDLLLMGKEALRDLLRGLLMLEGISIPELDLTYIASIAYDNGLIDRRDFSDVVELNLKLSGYGSADIQHFHEVFSRLLAKAASLDPYITQQMELYKY
jgi:hypothetical protein